MKRWLLCCWLLLVPGTLALASGRDFHDRLLAATPPYADERLTAYVRELGEAVVRASGGDPAGYTFTVLDSPVMNAFATRGGYVYVNRGLIAYAQNEAQLVSVLAHEVAHVALGHVQSQTAEALGAEALAVVAAVLSGSGEVYEATRMLGASVLRGHGRERELEADRAGARYMAALGYDPGQMLEMLALLKDVEAHEKERAAAGGARPSYHGLFATHPRNDARLRALVSEASRRRAGSDQGAARFRAVTEGLVWGENFAAKEIPPERFEDLARKVRIDFPQGWRVERTAAGARAMAPGGEASLSLEARPRTLEAPADYLRKHLGGEEWREERPLSPAGLKGHTAVAGGSPPVRLAVIYRGFDAWVARGEVQRAGDFRRFDGDFLAALETFRPLDGRALAGRSPLRIHWVRASPGMRYEALGRELGLSAEEVAALRLLNGHYPAGEPQPGQWLKILKRDPVPGDRGGEP